MRRLSQMKWMAVLIAFGILSAATLSGPAPARATLNPLTHCGTERWHIKTVDDPGVNHIVQTPKTATVAQLRQLNVPAGYSKNNDSTRYAPVEKMKYTVRARVLGFKEEADRDIHIEIADLNTGQTMIAEVPDPNCSTVQESGHAAQIAAVRDTIIACFGTPPTSSSLKTFSTTTIVSFTGVGFFDFVHTPPQTGVAPNAIELHPVILVKLEGNCPTGYVAHCACTVTSNRRAMQVSLLQRRRERTTSDLRRLRRR